MPLQSMCVLWQPHNSLFWVQEYVVEYMFFLMKHETLVLGNVFQENKMKLPLNFFGTGIKVSTKKIPAFVCKKWKWL